MFSFVILNYNSFDLTLECINYINNLETKMKKSIVVVDNNTLTKEDTKILKDKCDELVLNKTNVGFAKGNNIGINVCKSKFNSDFVCVLNSDCFIKQKNFIDNVIKIYDETNFDMLGPKLYSEDYLSFNPFPVFKSIEEIEKTIKYYEKLYIIYNNRFLNMMLNIYLKLKHHKKNIDRNGNARISGVALHGCCIIFSKKYLNKYNDAFYNDTFLFHEEEFLYYRVIKDNLISIYDDSIEAYHLEGASTKNTIGNKRKKLLFKTKYKLDSMKKLLKIYKNNNSI